MQHGGQRFKSIFAHVVARGDGVVPEQLHRAWRVIERVFQRIQIAAKVRRQFNPLLIWL